MAKFASELPTAIKSNGICIYTGLCEYDGLDEPL